MSVDIDLNERGYRYERMRLILAHFLGSRLECY